MEIENVGFQNKYNLSRRWGAAVEYIVIHYTATTASARNNCLYFSNGDRGASADYFIDDTSIYQFNPDTDYYYTWAVGDGRGRYGITNRNSISIEVVSDGSYFTDAEVERLSWLVKKLMDDYGIDETHLVRHYDASGKYCPLPYVDGSKWQLLKSSILKDDHEKKEEVFNMAECIFYIEDEHEGYPAQSRVYWNHETGFMFLSKTTSVGSTNFLKECGVKVVGSSKAQPYIKHARNVTVKAAQGTYGDLTPHA